MSEPLIIAIEGVDQAGKGTQSERLVGRLGRDGIDAELFSFPDYDTPVGRRIRRCLDRPEGTDLRRLHALLAENRREKLPAIRRALDKQRTLVMDRYCESNIAYGMASGLEREWLYGLDSEMPRPDLVILLDISAKESFRRKKERDAFEADRRRMERVVRTYRAEAEAGGWSVVDGSKDPDAVHAEIVKAVLGSLNSTGTSGL